jgi:ABC-2 type transport system permease protein
MESLKELWGYRQMIASLVRKELRTRYKGSILGFLWTFINPLLQLLVYSVVFSVIMRIDIDNYAMYLFVGLVPWIFCATSITTGSVSVIGSAGLVQKIYFPRIVLPIVSVCSNFMNMLYSFIIVVAALILTGTGISWYICYLPIIMVIEFVFVLGLAFVFSALTVFLRDLEHLLGIITMVWFYLTPILYSIDMIPDNFKAIAYANPMTSIIIFYRNILFDQVMPQFSTLITTVIFAVVLVVVGYFLFQKLQKRFAEEL